MNNTLDLDRGVDDDAKYTVNGKVINDLIAIINKHRATEEAAEQLEKNKELTELRLRDKNPALKAAWDQYLVVKELIK